MSATTKASHKYVLLVEIDGGFDLVGKIYVKIKIPNQKAQKTSIVKDNDNNPVWNESFLFHLYEIPKQIEFEVKEDRALLPNIVLGNYIVDIHYDLVKDITTPVKLTDGIIELNNNNHSRLKIKAILQCSDTNAINNLQSNQLQSTISNTSSLSSNTHKEKQEQKDLVEQEDLVEQKNLTVQKDLTEQKDLTKQKDLTVQKNLVEQKNLEQQSLNTPIQTTTNNLTINSENISQTIEQPVEIHRKIIHVERPKIIEVPIVKETHEYIRENPTYIRYDPNIIKEDLGNKDISQLSQEEANQLHQYVNESVDGKSNIIYEKELIHLEPKTISRPDEIREEEIIYEQPIEIERRHIENIHPKVYEKVTIEKEHVHVKTAPEIKVDEVKTIQKDDKYYTMNKKEVGVNDINATNTTNTINNNIATDTVATTTTGNNNNVMTSTER